MDDAITTITPRVNRTLRSRVPLPLSLARLMRCAFVLAVCLPLPGCTIGVWRTALARETKLYRVEAVFAAKDSNPESSRYAVVSYACRHGMCMLPVVDFYAIPLGDARTDLFSYQGYAKNVDAILDDLSPERLETIKSYHFSKESGKLASELFKDIHYKSVDKLESGWPRAGHAGVSVLPYFLRDASTHSLSREPYDLLAPLSGPGCKVLVLPATQQRSFGNRLEDVVGTAIFTPFVIVGDILFLPAMFIDPDGYFREVFS